MTNDQLSPNAEITNQHSPSVSGIQNFVILSSLDIRHFFAFLISHSSKKRPYGADAIVDFVALLFSAAPRNR